jgi:pimeloyl-ACP methyl ester carboxylesterase
MNTLAFDRSGNGSPLVLLHPLGSSRRVWDPVLPVLAERHDVIAVDLPGFGESEPLPAAVEPHPAALAAAVGRQLDHLGIEHPHLVGNSLGGWIALELAQQRPVASVTLLSPAGLWPGSTPGYQMVSLRASHWLSVHAAGPLDRLVGSRLGRIVVLGQTHGRPGRMTPEQARRAVTALGSGPGFAATLQATAHRHYVGGSIHGAPVTIAFGSRDRVLVHRSRSLDQLPPGTVAGTLPRCGHLPMADDPAAVAGLIITSTSRAEAARGRR